MAAVCTRVPGSQPHRVAPPPFSLFGAAARDARSPPTTTILDFIAKSMHSFLLSRIDFIVSELIFSECRFVNLKLRRFACRLKGNFWELRNLSGPLHKI